VLFVVPFAGGLARSAVMFTGSITGLLKPSRDVKSGAMGGTRAEEPATSAEMRSARAISMLIAHTVTALARM
jgi:hypothetical protein